MAAITKPNTFSAGEPIQSAKVNANYDTIYNDYNGNITNANIAAGAAIPGSKLDLSVPGTIGGTTPSPGTFTNITATTITANNISISTNLVVSGDIYTAAWTDYSTLSTINGWSTITTKQIYTKKIGKMVFFAASIIGTSNSTDVSFTLPDNNGMGMTASGTLGAAMNNGTNLTTVAQFELSNTSATVNCYTDMNGAVWGAAGNKLVRLQGFYHTA